MAFLPFDEHGNALLSSARAAKALAAEPARTSGYTALSALEWAVVRVARRDRLSTLVRPGRLSEWMRRLARLPNPRLADPRLEALRRMAVLTWRYGFTVPGRDVKTFLDAGFTPDQYEALAAGIGAARLARA
jgi:hypothetical protein